MSAIDPPADLFQAVESALARHANLTDGAVATYIPELAAADPSLFGLAVCTVDGDIVAAGAADAPFTIQSICKPFLYAHALSTLGATVVHQHVGVEPSGDRFDSIVRVESGAHVPHNPMVNAGALAVAGLLSAHAGEADPAALLAPYTGRATLPIDERTYASEDGTADRNRAIAYLMAHLGMLAAQPEAALRLYLRACSVSVSCRDLAVMGATLAAGGVNPATGIRVLDRSAARDTLAIMSTCGMYDGTGRFEVDVGMPAKSGVAGGVLAAAPGRLGIAAFSPPLDERGNSVRGVSVLRDLARDRSLHMFDATAPTPAPFRAPLNHVADVLERVHAAAPTTHGGAIADYLAATTDVTPDEFGLAVCTTGGEEWSVGDAARRFTIQAAANPFAYARALADVGSDAVHERVGVEPSGNPYNAIRLHPTYRRPYNALANAGAIAVAGMFVERVDDGAGRHLAAYAADLAGADALPLDERVLAAERENHRNRAIAFLLRNCGVIQDVEGAFALYAEQCARTVTCVELARMAAVLATNGRHPITGRRLLPPEHIPTVLTVMYTCGLHDGSGRFAFEVGLPGKAGVSGAILAVVPGAMGIAVYAPPVDPQGTSVRGFAALSEISRTLDLGVFASVA
ncbi:MAG: glutaminase A [Gemmatimonadales bacterium]|jgi:glutaminase